MFLRLVGGLASEKVRWAESVQKFKEEEKTLAGDVLLTSSYLSYVGCFGRSYRIDLLEQQWLKFLSTQEVHYININLLCATFTTSAYYVDSVVLVLVFIPPAYTQCAQICKKSS